MKHPIVLILMLLLSCTSLLAQQSSSAYYADYKSVGFSLAKMNDHDLYAFTGPGIMRIDSGGFSPWNKRYLTSGVSFGRIKKTLNNELLMLVTHASIGFGNGDVLFFRIDSVGNIRWIKVFGTTNREIPADFIELPDGNILLLLTATQFSGSDSVMVLAALSGNGDQLWQRSYHSDGGSVVAKSMTRSRDGSLYGCGNTASEGIMIRVTESGQMLWSQAYPEGFIEDIEPDPLTGGVFICGMRNDPVETGITSAFVARQDVAGQILWQRSLLNDFSRNGSAALCLNYDSLNHHILAGGKVHVRGVPASDDQAMTMVIDTQGNYLSGSMTGSSGREYFQDVCIMSNHSVFWSGYTNSFGTDTNILLIKTAADGLIGCWSAPLTGTFDTTKIQVYNPGYIQDTGNLDVMSLCFPPDSGFSSVKDLCSASGIHEEVFALQELRAFPNPNHGYCTLLTGMEGGQIVNIELYNALGQQMTDFYTSVDPSGKILFRAGVTCPPGLYTVKIGATLNYLQTKMLILK